MIRTGAAGGTGLFADGNHNVSNIGSVNTPLIKGNTFQNFSAGANLGRYAFANGEISENTFTGSTGVGIQGGIQNTLIARNTFTGAGATAQGLQLRAVFGEDPTDATKGAFNNTITENTFSGNASGDIFLSDAQFPGTIATNIIHGNSFSSAISINYAGSETIDASQNWFGSNVPATVAGTIQNLKNERQWVGIKNGVAGTFKLGYLGNFTGDLPLNNSTTVRTALEALPGIGAGNVAVSLFGTALDTYRRVYIIEFRGTLASTNVSQLVVDETLLTGGLAPRAAIATITEGNHAFAVDYTPWFDSGADTSGTTGFQGDYSSLHVSAAGAQFGGTGRITEAYNVLSSPGTIHVHTGTYVENVDLGAGANKAVTLAAGASPGQVVLTGNLTLTSNDTLPIELTGAGATLFDSFQVSGSVTLGNATLSAALTFSPTAGTEFTIIDKTSAPAISGTFNGIVESNVYLLGGFEFQATYLGGLGDNNNFVRDRTQTPLAVKVVLALVG